MNIIFVYFFKGSSQRRGEKHPSIDYNSTLDCSPVLTFQFVWVIKLWSWHLQIQFIHILPKHSFDDEKQSFEDGRQSFEDEK